jgi:hypothetical protein
MKTSPFLRTGYLLPRLLVLLFVADLVFRVIPLSALGFRTSATIRRKLPTAVGPFKPGAKFQENADFGDLANLGNMPEMRVYRKSSFTTDRFGFNNPFPLLRAPGIMLLGDSFTLPSDVPENRTLSAQLSMLSGKPVFNAGGESALQLGPLRDLAQRLGMHQGYVVFEFLERHLVESPPLRTDTGKSPIRSIPTRVLGVRRWEEIRLPFWSEVEFSPLQAMAQKLDKALSNGTFLPNRYSQNVLVRSLINGDILLFFAKDVANNQVPEGQVIAWANYFAWLSAELRKDGLDLVVLLVPNKYTVYQPFFAVPESSSRSEQNILLLQSRLFGENVPVVSLVGAFRKQAASDLENHEYLYWKDDSHWNERGMTIAAKKLADRIATQEFDQKPPSVTSRKSDLENDNAVIQVASPGYGRPEN